VISVLFQRKTEVTILIVYKGVPVTPCADLPLGPQWAGAVVGCPVAGIYEDTPRTHKEGRLSVLTQKQPKAGPIPAFTFA